jgi:hypothetical protein
VSRSVRRALLTTRLGLVAFALLTGASCGSAQSGETAPGGRRVYRNVSPAMEPTLRNGEPITVDLWADSATAHREARRGDLVLYAWPVDSTKRYAKRLVGVAGDTLAMAGGVLHRNGRPVPEPYAWHADSAGDPAVPEIAWQNDHRPGGDRRAALATDLFRGRRTSSSPHSRMAYRGR